MVASAPDVSGVFVIGEALIDIVESAGSVVEYPGGSPANVALGLGRMGHRVSLLTAVGDDQRGYTVTTRLRESGVDVLPESVGLDRTSTARAVIAGDGHADYAFDIVWQLPASSTGLPSKAAVVHTGSIAAFLEPGAARVREILRDMDAREVTFDPNIRPALVGPHAAALAVFVETAGHCTVIKLSNEDAEWLYPGIAVNEVATRILGIGPRLVAITLGAEGVLMASRGQRVRIPATLVSVVDTIGAGDTFMASLIHSLLEYPSSGALTQEVLERIGTRAARAAAVTVSRAGADLPWRDELVDASAS